jgi:hypothetical protein
VRDLLPTSARPLVAGVAAAAAAAFFQYQVASIQFPLVRLALAGAAMLAVYAWVLLFVMKQRDFYIDLLRGLLRAREMVRIGAQSAGGPSTASAA